MATYRPALQLIVEYNSLADAQQALQFVLTQDGCIGAKVLPACNQIDRTKDRLQAFFVDELPVGATMPDGMRKVIVPSTLAMVPGKEW